MKSPAIQRTREDVRRISSYLSFCMLLYLLLATFLPDLLLWVLRLCGVTELTKISALPPSAAYLFSMLTYTGSLLPPFALYAHLAGVSLPRRLFARRISRVCTVGIVGGSVTVILLSNYLLSLLASLFSKANLSLAARVIRKPADLWEGILLFLYLCVLPALLEELVFRGILLRSLRRFGERFAVVMSSLLFALVHRNLAQGLHAFVMGLLMGYFTVKTRSARISVWIHFINNLHAVLLSLAGYYAPDAAARLLLFTLLFAAFCWLVTLLPVRRWMRAQPALTGGATGVRRAFCRTPAFLGMAACYLFFFLYHLFEKGGNV